MPDAISSFKIQSYSSARLGNGAGSIRALRTLFSRYTHLSWRAPFFLALLLALVLLAPVDVLAQAADPTFPSERTLPKVVSYFRNLGAQINKDISEWAAAIFAIAAGIQACLFLWNIILEETARRSRREGGVRGLLRKLILYTIFISLGMGILQNNLTITDSLSTYLYADIVPFVLDGTCIGGSGSNTNPIDSSTVIEMGWWVFDSSHENMRKVILGGKTESPPDSSGQQAGGGKGETEEFWDWVMPDDAVDAVSESLLSAQRAFRVLLDPGTIIVFIANMLILPTFFVMAFQVVVTKITLYMVIAFLPIALAFLPLSFMSPFVSGYIRYYLFVALKLMFIYLILIPLLMAPFVVFAVTSDYTMQQLLQSGGVANTPLDNCTASSKITEPGEFTTPSTGTKAVSLWSRIDIALTYTGIAFASVGLLKTVPENLASYMTQNFDLRFLYDIYE